VDWFDADTPGLALRVTPAGARTWYAFYRVGRTTRRVKLGTFPALELAAARKKARKTRVQIDEGADPAHERKQSRDAFTVGDLATVYLEQHARAHKRTWKDDHWRLERYILPAWKSRPVAAITRADVHAVLDRIVADGHPIQANRVLALISKLWNVAIDRGHATVNPCYRMGKPAPERSRAIVLDDDQLRALWQALDAQQGDAADAIRLRLLTGQRGGEVHQMEWPEVDLRAGVWTIPDSKAKNHRAHRVPLSASALAILQARCDDRTATQPRVFPGLYHQREDLRELGAIHNGTYRWHDLRRTVATRLAGLGYSEEVIGRVLNHAKRGVTATIYNQFEYDGQKRHALDAWAHALSTIVQNEAPVSTVVPFAQG
jgi:integrase